MAYMTKILRVSQDFAGLGWIRYDAAFGRLVALSGNNKWSEINPTLYAMYFMGATRSTSRCDLCMATSHKTAQWALLGHNHPEFQASGPYMLESAPRPPQQLPTPGSGPSWCAPSGEICRLWRGTAAHLLGAGTHTSRSMAARKGFRTTTFQQTVITRLAKTIYLLYWLFTCITLCIPNVHPLLCGPSYNVYS